MNQMSVSFHTKKGATSIAHNNRAKEKHKDYNNDKIDRNKIQENVYLKQQSIEEAYELLFGNEVKAYNKTQKRKNRRIKNYYKDMKHSKKYDEQREIIVQVGRFEDFRDARDPSVMKQKAKEVLEKVYEDFQEKNKNLYVYNAVIHMDESTPHMHLNVVPVADGYSRGVKKKPGFNRAIEQQGSEGTNDRDRFDDWMNKNRKLIEQRMLEMNNWYLREIDQSERKKNKVENHFEYKKLMRVREELTQKEHELKNKKEEVNRTEHDLFDVKERVKSMHRQKDELNEEVSKLTKTAHDIEELKSNVRNEVEEEYAEHIHELHELREQREHDAELLELYEKTCKEYEMLADEITKEYVRLPEKIVKLVNGIASWGGKFSQDIWDSAFQRNKNQSTQQQQNRDDFER